MAIYSFNCHLNHWPGNFSIARHESTTKIMDGIIKNEMDIGRLS